MFYSLVLRGKAWAFYKIYEYLTELITHPGRVLGNGYLELAICPMSGRDPRECRGDEDHLVGDVLGEYLCSIAHHDLDVRGAVTGQVGPGGAGNVRSAFYSSSMIFRE